MESETPDEQAFIDVVCNILYVPTGHKVTKSECRDSIKCDLLALTCLGNIITTENILNCYREKFVIINNAINYVDYIEEVSKLIGIEEEIPRYNRSYMHRWLYERLLAKTSDSLTVLIAKFQDIHSKIVNDSGYIPPRIIPNSSLCEVLAPVGYGGPVYQAVTNSKAFDQQIQYMYGPVPYSYIRGFPDEAMFAVQYLNYVIKDTDRKTITLYASKRDGFNNDIINLAASFFATQKSHGSATQNDVTRYLLTGRIEREKTIIELLSNIYSYLAKQASGSYEAVADRIMSEAAGIVDRVVNISSTMFYSDLFSFFIELDQDAYAKLYSFVSKEFQFGEHYMLTDKQLKERQPNNTLNKKYSTRTEYNNGFSLIVQMVASHSVAYGYAIRRDSMAVIYAMIDEFQAFLKFNHSEDIIKPIVNDAINPDVEKFKLYLEVSSFLSKVDGALCDLVFTYFKIEFSWPAKYEWDNEVAKLNIEQLKKIKLYIPVIKSLGNP